MTKVISHPSFNRPPVMSPPRRGRLPKSVTVLRIYRRDRNYAEFLQARRDAAALSPRDEIAAEHEQFMRKAELVADSCYAELNSEALKITHSAYELAHEISGLRRRLVEKLAQILEASEVRGESGA